MKLYKNFLILDLYSVHIPMMVIHPGRISTLESEYDRVRTALPALSTPNTNEPLGK